MSREALSREISQVVSRVVSGEEIDAAARGAILAAKYPELGMSGEMIGEAILRAANMVGMIKSAPMPAAWPDDPPRAEDSAGVRAGAPLPLPSRAPEHDPAPAIGAELGEGANGEAKKAATENSETRRSPIAALRRAFFRQ
jgi:hypothetical protein